MIACSVSNSVLHSFRSQIIRPPVPSFSGGIRNFIGKCFPQQTIYGNGHIKLTFPRKAATSLQPGHSQSRKSKECVTVATEKAERHAFHLSDDIVCGLDEAGRGPVLGPLVVAAVSMKQSTAENLKLQGLKDSKLLSPAKRDRLFALVRSSALVYKSILIPAPDLDSKRKKMNLNEIEGQTMLRAAKHCFKGNGFRRLYIDSVDVNADRFASSFRKAFPHSEIVCQHKADLNFPAVSAASVIAKVIRDREMQKLEKKYGVPLGSGYPSDPTTINFLRQYYKQNKKMPPIARHSWQTLAKLM